MLHSTLPKTQAEAAILARSRLITDFRWTPVRDVPTYTRSQGNTVLPAGREVVGFPYASTERTDCFLTENISFESFLTAIPNPDSRLYQPGHAAFSACNFGIVCNGLVRYAFGIRRRVSTARWYTIPGMREIAKRQAYTAGDIRLLDILYAFGEGRNHVALITDILRDDTGTVVEIEVSEAVRPACIRVCYSVSQFMERFRLFGLCRYDFIEDAPAFNEHDRFLLTESGLEKHPPVLAVDKGSKSNYAEGEEILFSVFAEGADTLEIYRGDTLVSEHKTFGRAMIPSTLARGYYTARLKNADAAVAFCVCRPDIRHEVHDGTITVWADAHDEQSRILYADFRQKGCNVASLEKYEELTECEIASGCFTRPIPAGGENFKIYWENPYGVWTHTMIKI